MVRHASSYEQQLSSYAQIWCKSGAGSPKKNGPSSILTTDSDSATSKTPLAGVVINWEKSVKRGPKKTFFKKTF